MGKHERQSIAEAEKIIVKILNSHKIDKTDKANYWFNHAVTIAKKIKNDFPKITSAIHLGNRYDNTGDILILLNKKEVFIEIKMSDTKLSKGTMANINQNALTENYLFANKVENWSSFRQENNHDKWVKNFLDKFTNYPHSISKINNLELQKEEKARYLRKLAKRKNKKAKNILDNIHKKDREE